jgi:hypothetical protein
LSWDDFNAAAGAGDNRAVTTFLALLLYALVATILLAFIYALKSLRLQNRFKRLGVLPGRSVDEILKFVGKPSHRARLDARTELLEWRRVGFHIALRFTDGVCDGAEAVA